MENRSDVVLQLMEGCKTAQDVLNLCSSDTNLEFSQETARCAARKILDDCGDDMFRLLSVTTLFGTNADYNYRQFPHSIATEVLEMVMDRYKDFDVLILLYVLAQRMDRKDEIRQEAYKKLLSRRLLKDADGNPRKLSLLYTYLKDEEGFQGEVLDKLLRKE